MSNLYILDVPENTGVAKVAAADESLTVGKVGPYFEIRGTPIVIDRRATGCRHSVWYSVVGGVSRGSRVTQHDKDALRIEAE